MVIGLSSFCKIMTQFLSWFSRMSWFCWCVFKSLSWFYWLNRHTHTHKCGIFLGSFYSVWMEDCFIREILDHLYFSKNLYHGDEGGKPPCDPPAHLLVGGRARKKASFFFCFSWFWGVWEREAQTGSFHFKIGHHNSVWLIPRPYPTTGTRILVSTGNSWHEYNPVKSGQTL